MTRFAMCENESVIRLPVEYFYEAVGFKACAGSWPCSVAQQVRREYSRHGQPGPTDGHRRQSKADTL